MNLILYNTLCLVLHLIDLKLPANINYQYIYMCIYSILYHDELTVAKGPSSMFIANQEFQFGWGGDHGITPVDLTGFGSLNSASTWLEINDNDVSELTTVSS